MYTSIVLLALSSYFTHAIPTSSSATWLRDYDRACDQCKQEKRPLAVFLATGLSGWKNLSEEGKINPKVLWLLEQEYVCVYIDTSTRSGKRLSESFEMPDGLGIVISDRKGEKQAFRHEGRLFNSDLERYLRKYADPNLIVRRTDSNPAQPKQSYSPPPSIYTPSFTPGMQIFGGGGGGGC